MAASAGTQSTKLASSSTGRPAGAQGILSLPPKWLHMYDEFITKNASQVSQIESALRSLTYIIPGRFRDAEIASESIHSGVQLLSLYHDTILSRALTLSKLPLPSIASAHSRYTRFWTQKSTLYRRVAYMLQIVSYTELLCEMAAKRRGEKMRWRIVVLLEAIKAVCRLLLLRITKLRPLVTPVLPERAPIPEPDEEPAPDDEEAILLEEAEAQAQARAREEALAQAGEDQSGNASEPPGPPLPPPPPRPFPSSSPASKEWSMPRTGMSLPSLPAAGDISTYLLSRVLTADDIKPATKLLHTLHGSAQAAEILHILAPLVYAVALARAKDKRSWVPWALGLSVELAARQLRDLGGAAGSLSSSVHSSVGGGPSGLRATALERDEWSRRGWAMGWWAMRGAFYENVTRGLVEGVRARVPSLVGGILEDYEYLWENYYFATSG